MGGWRDRQLAGSGLSLPGGRRPPCAGPRSSTARQSLYIWSAATYDGRGSSLSATPTAAAGPRRLRGAAGGGATACTCKGTNNGGACWGKGMKSTSCGGDCEGALVIQKAISRRRAAQPQFSLCRHPRVQATSVSEMSQIAVKVGPIGCSRTEQAAKVFVYERTRAYNLNCIRMRTGTDRHKSFESGTFGFEAPSPDSSARHLKIRFRLKRSSKLVVLRNTFGCRYMR